MHEFRRRLQFGVGPDRPVAIVEIEFGFDVSQVDVGLPIGVDRTDVAPIGLALGARTDAGLGEAVRHRLPVLDDVGDDVLAEIAGRFRLLGVAAKLIHEELRLEHIDAHRGECVVRSVGDAGRIGRLLDEGDDRILAVDMHHPEARRLHARHFQAADRHVRALVDVLAQHLLVIHLVDVVAGQDHHELRPVGLDDVDVLVDRVRRAFIPLRLRDALARRQYVEAFVSLRPQEVPAALQVADQRMRLVLRRHSHSADARIQCVGQREVDDARLAAEIDRRLGAPVGQFLQPAAAPSRKHIGHGVARQRLRALAWLHHPTLPGHSSVVSSSMIVDSGGKVTAADTAPRPPASACTAPPLPMPEPP